LGLAASKLVSSIEAEDGREDMQHGPQRIAKTIRMREEVYHQARVAAVTAKKSLGQWIEEAVFEKLDREQRSNYRRA
jgi:predicted HicB family RNase H-like nuclease